MKNAGKAMKEIHGKMTMEDVDTTMYVSFPSFPLHSLRRQTIPTRINTIGEIQVLITA